MCVCVCIYIYIYMYIEGTRGFACHTPGSYQAVKNSIWYKLVE